MEVMSVFMLSMEFTMGSVSNFKEVHRRFALLLSSFCVHLMLFKGTLVQTQFLIYALLF